MTFASLPPRLSVTAIVFVTLCQLPASANEKSNADVESEHSRVVQGITAADLKTHVSFLASDTLKGRRGGTDDARAAAAYLAEQFRAYGLRPESKEEGFRQEFGQLGLQNVVGVWGPADSPLAPIIVSAHYDHVGTGGKGTRKEFNGQIHNGADDNASGTALVLELAQAFTSLPQPTRPIVFALWDGEEQGLIGSGEYAKTHELSKELPALAFVCDMVGRSSCNRVYVYGVDTVTGLESIVTGQQKTMSTGNPLEPLFIRKHLPRSDHWPFYSRNVPYLLFHTGLHESYHRPTDDADTLDYEAAESISRLAFEVLYELAFTDFDLSLNKASKELPITNLPPKSTCDPIDPKVLIGGDPEKPKSSEPSKGDPTPAESTKPMPPGG